MTTRLYYHDASLLSFDAEVRTSEPAGDRTHAVLDRSAFYPSSGGQPFDRGTLSGIEVVDVFEKDEDGSVVHVLAAALPIGSTVVGRVDAARRHDHMQQHTGQHILSAAFERVLNVRTTSFHMGGDVSTIDLSREVSAAEVTRAEDEANAVVWENRPVHVRFVSDAEAAALPLRKPSTRTGLLRIVEIPDFDLSACGGTHVSQTAAVGLIAVTATERSKGATRLTFVCGARALRSHRALRDVVTDATRVVSSPPEALAGAIERVMQHGKDLDRTVHQLRGELAAARAREWRARAETIGPVRGVLMAEAESQPAILKTMAAAVVEAPGFVAVVVGVGDPVPVVIARSADVTVDANRLLQQVIAELGGRGGGRPNVAQGGVTAEPVKVVEMARTILRGSS